MYITVLNGKCTLNKRYNVAKTMQLAHIKLTERDILIFNLSVISKNDDVTSIMTLFLNYDSVLYHSSVFYRNPLMWSSF